MSYRRWLALNRLEHVGHLLASTVRAVFRWAMACARLVQTRTAVRSWSARAWPEEMTWAAWAKARRGEETLFEQGAAMRQPSIHPSAQHGCDRERKPR